MASSAQRGQVMRLQHHDTISKQGAQNCLSRPGPREIKACASPFIGDKRAPALRTFSSWSSTSASSSLPAAGAARLKSLHQPPAVTHANLLDTKGSRLRAQEVRCRFRRCFNAISRTSCAGAATRGTGMLTATRAEAVSPHKTADCPPRSRAPAAQAIPWCCARIAQQGMLHGKQAPGCLGATSDRNA